MAEDSRIITTETELTDVLAKGVPMTPERMAEPTHEEQCGDACLIGIYRHHGAASDKVVRWCAKCGAVVIDEDYDGRTNAGTVMAMRFPRNRAEIQRLEGVLEQIYSMCKGYGGIPLIAALIESARRPK